MAPRIALKTAPQEPPLVPPQNALPVPLNKRNGSSAEIEIIKETEEERQISRLASSLQELYSNGKAPPQEQCLEILAELHSLLTAAQQDCVKAKQHECEDALASLLVQGVQAPVRKLCCAGMCLLLQRGSSKSVSACFKGLLECLADSASLFSPAACRLGALEGLLALLPFRTASMAALLAEAASLARRHARSSAAASKYIADEKVVRGAALALESQALAACQQMARTPPATELADAPSEGDPPQAAEASTAAAVAKEKPPPAASETLYATLARVAAAAEQDLAEIEASAGFRAARAEMLEGGAVSPEAGALLGERAKAQARLDCTLERLAEYDKHRAYRAPAPVVVGASGIRDALGGMLSPAQLAMMKPEQLKHYLDKAREAYPAFKEAVDVAVHSSPEVSKALEVGRAAIESGDLDRVLKIARAKGPEMAGQLGEAVALVRKNWGKSDAAGTLMKASGMEAGMRSAGVALLTMAVAAASQGKLHAPKFDASVFKFAKSAASGKVDSVCQAAASVLDVQKKLMEQQVQKVESEIDRVLQASGGSNVDASDIPPAQLEALGKLKSKVHSVSNFLRQENDGLIDTIAQGRQALLHSVLGSMPVDASEGAEKVKLLDAAHNDGAMAAKESTDAEVNAGKEDAAWEARVAKMVTLATLLTSFHLALRGQPIYQEFLQALAHHIRNTWQQARRAGQCVATQLATQSRRAAKSAPGAGMACVSIFGVQSVARAGLWAGGAVAGAACGAAVGVARAPGNLSRRARRRLSIFRRKPTQSSPVKIIEQMVDPQSLSVPVPVESSISAFSPSSHEPLLPPRSSFGMKGDASKKFRSVARGLKSSANKQGPDSTPGTTIGEE